MCRFQRVQKNHSKGGGIASPPKQGREKVAPTKRKREERSIHEREEKHRQHHTRGKQGRQPHPKRRGGTAAGGREVAPLTREGRGKQHTAMEERGS